jgi:hypothetical protein
MMRMRCAVCVKERAGVLTELHVVCDFLENNTELDDIPDICGVWARHG